MKVKQELLEGHEYNSVSSKTKRLSLAKVNAETRVQIVKMASNKARTYKEIGEIFNVRTSAVA